MSICFISDVHSQYHRLKAAVAFAESQNLRIVLLGDIFDSRVEYSDTVGVLNLVDSLIKKGNLCVNSNHQDKLIRHLKGNNVRINNGLDITIQQLEEADVNKENLFKLLTSFAYGVVVKNSHGKEFRAAHAYFSSKTEVKNGFVYRSDLARRHRDVFIYGKTDRDQNRIAWWLNSNQEQSFVRVAGHYHQVYVDDFSVVLDSGCGSGGCLSLYNGDTGVIKEF